MILRTFFPPRGFPESALKLLELVLGLSRWSEGRTPPASGGLRSSWGSENAALKLRVKKVDFPRTTGGERSG